MKILLIILLSLGFVHAQQSFNLSIDTNQILIGERATLSLELSTGNKATWIGYSLNEDINYLQDKIEIVEVSDIDTSFNSKLPTYSQSITITAFDTGYFVIKPLQIILPEIGDTIESNPLLLNVVYPELSEEENKELADIKSQIEKPFELQELLRFWWVLLVVLALLIAWKFWKKYKERSVLEVEVKAPKVPAHVVALEKLKSLELSKAWENQTSKEFLSQISYITREYTETRYNVLALENTTFEVKSSLIDKLNSKDLEDLISLLEDIDLAKFAKSDYSDEENKSYLLKSIQWIEKTKEVSED